MASGVHRLHAMRYGGERLFATASALLLAIVAGSCTASETSVTAPTAQKCQVSASGSPVSFDASGGSGTLAISAARDCTWSLTVDSSWVTVGGDHSGQGDASIGFTVGANPQTAGRSATVAVSGQSVRLSQSGAPCVFSLSRTGDAIGAAGGSLSVGVNTLAGCSWSATTSTPWISIASGQNGNASATVALGIAANPGAARVGQVNIAGQIYSVNQDGASSPTPSPSPSPSPAPSPSPSPTPPPGGGVEGFSGVVGNVSGKCPNLTFNVSSATVMTDKETKFKDISCGDVAKGGRMVTGSGPTDSNNVIHADIVQKATEHDD